MSGFAPLYPSYPCVLSTVHRGSHFEYVQCTISVTTEGVCPSAIQHTLSTYPINFHRITRNFVELSYQFHRITRHFVDLSDIQISRHLQMLSHTFQLVYDITGFLT